MYDDDEAKGRAFRNRFDAFSQYDDTFIDTFQLIKILIKMICEEIREDLCLVSGVRTALSVKT